MEHLIQIYGIYIALLQDNYLEALPTQAWSKRKVFSSLYKELDRFCSRERI